MENTFTPLEDVVSHQDLPREVPLKRPRVGYVMLLALITLCVVNMLAGYVLKHNGTNRGYRILAAKYDLVAKTPAVDTLLIGDSSCNQGLIPGEWTKATGESTVNLCTIAYMTTIGDVWMLERYIERHGPPKKVVITHVYDVWQRHVQVVLLGQISGPWGFWEDTYAPLNLSDSQQKTLFQSRYLPIWSESKTLRSMVLDPKRNVFEVWDDGYMPWEEAVPHAVVNDARAHVNYTKRSKPQISHTNKRGLKGLNRLAEEHNIQIHMVVSPVSDIMGTSKDWNTFVETLIKQGRALTPSKNVVWHTERFSYPKDKMENADHIITGAAADYTRRVATMTQTKP